MMIVEMMMVVVSIDAHPKHPRDVIPFYAIGNCYALAPSMQYVRQRITMIGECGWMDGFWQQGVCY